jgi:hypothetical protein
VNPAINGWAIFKDKPIADDEAASGAPERFAFRQRANVAQAFGHDAAGFAENSPAIYGWEQRNSIFKVPSGTAEHFFRP